MFLLFSQEEIKLGSTLIKNNLLLVDISMPILCNFEIYAVCILVDINVFVMKKNTFKFVQVVIIPLPNQNFFCISEYSKQVLEEEKRVFI